MLQKQKDNVKSYFNDTSKEYSYVYEMENSDSVRAYIFLARKKNALTMFDQEGGRVLDVGCGPAVFAEELLNKDCEVWNIDISEAMIENAKRKIQEKGIRGKLHFAVGDIEKLDFPDKYFDFVLCLGVLEYLKDDSLALSEIRRVLKDKGGVIFTVPNMASPFTLLDKAILMIVRLFLKIFHSISNVLKIETKISPRRLLFRDDIIDRYYWPWSFNNLLSRNGFKIDKSIFHVYRLAALSSVFPWLSVFIAKKLELLSKSPFRWMGINYIVKTTKE